ncbi:MAG: IS66 family transposase [Chloroflexota bacterium]|nr:IS66 family transposase [Chloroflexota bacterium]
MKDVDREALEQLDRAALIALVLAQQARIAALEAQVAALAARVEELSGEPPAPPAPRPLPPFVKPARPAPAPERSRKKRQVHFARRRDTPTRVVERVPDACPHCGAPLAGGEVVRRRQVLHVPRVPVEIIEHVVRRRVCPRCARGCTPVLDLSDQVLGHHRVSSETMAYIASLRTVGRLPLRTIQWLLAAWHGLRLSAGALVGILKAVAARAGPALAQLRAAVRGSPVVCADETGWREDGQPGHSWTFSTPTLRLFHYAHSRGGAVVQEVLGEVYEGVLVSDFYAAYNVHDGPHQRCWVHLLRDAHDLRVAHPDDAEVAAWADAVHALYLEAKQRAAGDADGAARAAARADLERRLSAACAPYWAPGSTRPQATLCQRIDRFLDELFEFVVDPAIPPDNNLAERNLRPLVIARKISGGTRSDEGSQTRMALHSLFGTWQAQGRDPFTTCHQMLLAPAL